MTARQIIPAYTWAGDDTVWSQRLAEIMPGDLAIMIGPNSGPPRNQAERDALKPRIAQVRARGAIRFGYVALGYGNRPLERVAVDIDLWRAVGVSRIFGDELPRGWPVVAMLHRSQTSRYRPPSGVILVANPGVRWEGPCPLDTIIVTHENRYAAGLPSHTPKPWEACIVHECPVDLLAATRAALAAAGWQWTYITADGADFNAFDEATTDADS